jgi:hypothetical protein
LANFPVLSLASTGRLLSAGRNWYRRLRMTA